MATISEINKIAVLKPSGIGDFIFSLPAILALRETFPESKIHYVGKEWHRIFLEKRESPVDKVIVIPKVKGVGESEEYQNNESEIKEFLTRMQGEYFDLAVQMHGGGGYSNEFIGQFNSKISIGTKTSAASDLSMMIPYEYYQSEYIRWLEVVSLVGARTKLIMPMLSIHQEDVNEAEKLLEGTDNNIIVIHPGANDIRRRWSPVNFAHVGDHFAEKGYTVVVTGSGDEKQTVKEVLDNMKNKCINTYNKLSINGLAGILYKADVVISNDTGPLHLADALGVKTVGIYWCSNMINAAPPFRKNSICLSSWTVTCPLCGTDCATGFPFDPKSSSCQHKTSFVSGVSYEDVVKSGQKLLDN